MQGLSRMFGGCVKKRNIEKDEKKWTKCISKWSKDFHFREKTQHQSRLA